RTEDIRRGHSADARPLSLLSLAFISISALSSPHRVAASKPRHPSIRPPDAPPVQSRAAREPGPSAAPRIKPRRRPVATHLLLPHRVRRGV
ncbi:uncharacterized protein SCHCODRAFT_02197588, partial [Schizophyllum commune H4-8]|uniref:uncharacterized protein n=1 Tax=Schizophyllum commune (strain H4-8 / FGSC 9210) TaxID=578458 RepID=UPI00215E2CF6